MAQKIRVELELLGEAAADLRSGDTLRLEGDQVRAEVVSVEQGHGFADGQSVGLLLTFAVGVSSQVVASALYDWARARIRRIAVEGRRVQKSPEALAAAIESSKRPSEGGASPG